MCNPVVTVSFQGRRVIHPGSYLVTIGDVTGTVNLRGQSAVLAEHPFKKR